MMVRITLLITKLIRFILVKMGRGGSLPGNIAMHICPNFLSKIKYPDVVVMVTGTNGKTSTSNMAFEMLQTKYQKVVGNRRGDNMKEGITTLVLANTGLDLKCNVDAIVMEVDELNVPKILAEVPVTHFIVTNFFRDQLDRAGEMETVVSKIENALPLFKGELLLNGNDPNVARLGYGRENTYYFGVDENNRSVKVSDEASEGKFCFHCHALLVYEYYQYSHVGKFTCPNCNFAKYTLDAVAKNVDVENKLFSVDGVMFTSPQNNIYTMYNCMADILLAKRLGMDLNAIVPVFEKFKLHDGRNETLNIGKKCVMNLIKNPTGANETMKYIVSDPADKDILIALNDNVQDGTDISWIWDANFELIFNDDVKNIVCTGLRAYEMALRIKYSDFKGNVMVLEDMEEAVAYFKDLENHAYVLSVYTALQPMRTILRRYVV